jgi:formylmethanofuran dehydrogenase subunit B
VNRSKIDGKHVSVEDVMSSTVEILDGANNPILLGFDRSTLEAQEKGIELAKRLDAIIPTTYFHPVLKKILDGSIKTCTLDDVRDNADVVIYWGSDPESSHPRHLSKFSYFPRGKLRKKGMEDRSAICIDVRETPTSKICDINHIIPPRMDGALMKDIMDVLDGRIPKSFLGKKKLVELSNSLRKAEYGIIFIGSTLGRVSGALEELMERTGFHLIPMVEHNAIGFARLHSGSTTFMEALQKADAALIVGADPLSTVPLSISRRLLGIPTITVDSFNTPTTVISDVVIPSAIDGIEDGGKVLRMDSREFQLGKIVDGDEMSEEGILSQIITSIDRT